MTQKIYVNDLAYFLLNKGEHDDNYDVEKTMELVNRRGEEIFILYYLISLKNDLTIVNLLNEKGILEVFLDKFKTTIEEFKESLNQPSNFVKYTSFLDEIIDMKEDVISDEDNFNARR